jgi:carbonic anhydrase
MEIEQIFRNNKIWIAEKLKVDEDYFIKLSKGQHPEILSIGCSESI